LLRRFASRNDGSELARKRYAGAAHWPWLPHVACAHAGYPLIQSGPKGLQLVGQTEQVRAFHQFVCYRWDQSDIQEKAISEARFEFERPPNNRISFF